MTQGRWAVVLYQLAFPACIVFGSVGDLTAVWQLVDIFNGLLAAPNLLALLLLSPEVVRQLHGWLSRRRESRAGDWMVSHNQKPHLPLAAACPSRTTHHLTLD